MGGKLYGLLGRRLGHSWSVPIHAALGRPDYRLIELEPEALPAFLAGNDLGGVNVTIPYKREVMAFCKEIAPTALAIGSVNTLVRRNGELLGFNTDADGFRFMAERARVSFAGAKVLVLGSGGASLTVQAVSRTMGAREVVVVSRSGENSYRNLSRHADADIVVNATPVGMYPENGTAPVDLSAFSGCRGVLDLVYNPQKTALLLRAGELGIPCSDGLPMLVAQARAAEEVFFGKPLPFEENERVLALLRREMTNIVLIGMPGCGKSSVGAALSRLTGREAVDTDRLIELRTGRAIPDIFARDGEAAFRELEREELERAGKLGGRIIVTGGGAVKDARNYAALRQNGRIYQLTRGLALLPREGRPLSQSRSPAALWAERAPLYAGFRDAVIENSGTVEETAAAVWRDFYENSCDKRA